MMGCGNGSEEMIRALLEKYDDFKPLFDELEDEQRDEVIEKMNEF